MNEDQICAVMALADDYALTGYSAVSLTLAKAMPQRAALESALRAMPSQALAPLSEGALMGVYMDFDRNAERTWLPAEYLLRFAAAVQQAVLKGVQP